MHLGAPKDLSQLRRFFLHPRLPKHRQYEALRAFVVEGLPAKDVARTFGYSLNAFYVLCHHFRRQPVNGSVRHLATFLLQHLAGRLVWGAWLEHFEFDIPGRSITL